MLINKHLQAHRAAHSSTRARLVLVAGAGARFALIVHHTDAEREWAYDQNSSIGRLDKALDEAQAKGWTVVDMKNDWKVVFPFEGK